MAAAEQALSKESFGNNADLLVFPDRHEYRTRSRLGYVSIGVISLLAMAMCLWGWLLLLVIWPSQEAALGAPDRTVGYIMTPILVPFAVFFFITTLGFFRTNPWIIISPAGLEFRNRLEFMHLRAKNFLVEFGDVETVEITTSADTGGRFRVQPAKFFYALKISTDERGGLLLRWRTYSRAEAARFAEAFMVSMKEMATRFSGPR